MGFWKEHFEDPIGELLSSAPAEAWVIRTKADREHELALAKIYAEARQPKVYVTNNYLIVNGERVKLEPEQLRQVRAAVRKSLSYER